MRRLCLAGKLQILFLNGGSWLWPLGLVFLAAAVPLQLKEAWINYVYFASPDSTATVGGHVVNSESTKLSIGGEPVYAIEFEYTLDQQRYQGYSFSPGWRYETGDEIEVEYLRWHPEISRVRGSNYAKFMNYPLVLLAIGAILLMAYSSVLRSRWRWVDFLENGYQTTARLISSSATRWSHLSQPVYELSFAYTTAQGEEKEFSVRTHHHERLREVAHESVFYHPKWPERVVLLDRARLPIKFESGRWCCTNPSAVFSAVALRLVLPLAILVCSF